MKRLRNPVAKLGELKAAWGRVERGDTPSLVYAYGAGGAGKPDARILSTALEELIVFNGKSLIEELEVRGYDLTTLKFSIQQKVV